MGNKPYVEGEAHSGSSCGMDAETLKGFARLDFLPECRPLQKHVWNWLSEKEQVLWALGKLADSQPPHCLVLVLQFPLMRGVPITVVNGSSLLPVPLFLDGEGLGHSLPPYEEFQHKFASLLWPWVSCHDFTQSSSMTFLLRGCGVGSVGKGTCCARQRPEFESPDLCKSWLCKMRFCNSVVPQEDGRWTEGPGSSGTS